MRRISIILGIILCWLPAITVGEQYGEILPDGLYSIQGLWHLNDNSSSESDSSGNGNIATVSGATYTADGKFGGAYNFDGSDDFLIVSDDDTLDFSSAITIACWLKYSSAASGWDVILAKGAYNEAYSIFLDAGVSLWYHLDGVQTAIDTNYILSTDTWLWLCLTYDGSSISIYVDAEEIYSLSASGSITTNANPLYFGRDSAGNRLTGSLDDICLWDRGLTATEVKQLYAMQKGAYGIH